MRAAFSLAILALVSSVQAVRLDDAQVIKTVPAPEELVQVDTEAKADAAAYPPEPYSDDCCHDDDYYCPPCLEKAPGVMQPPGPSKSAICARPLCYCNHGFMHTDWDHNVSVDDKKPCDYDCYKPPRPHKKPIKMPKKPVFEYDDDYHVTAANPSSAIPEINESDLLILGPETDTEEAP